ncbi:hypothetical protein RP20_CCG010047 [Aedes albopictus]|nr:hypothetical protein RP20_CCG010047 [Aedes albopictus]
MSFRARLLRVENLCVSNSSHHLHGVPAKRFREVRPQQCSDSYLPFCLRFKRH